MKNLDVKIIIGSIVAYHIVGLITLFTVDTINGVSKLNGKPHYLKPIIFKLSIGQAVPKPENEKMYCYCVKN